MICIICCEDSQRVDLKKCQCQICSGCLILYIKTSNENINIDSHITCPGECGSIYKIDELIIFQELQRDLNIVLLLKYLRTEKDIRACPKNNCGNFGIMPNIKCNSQLMCDACQYQWEAPELYTNHKKLIVSVVNYKQTTHFFLNQVSQIFLTKQCPKCFIPILKDGGCNHMTCRQCHFEFCWQCKQDHYNHKKYRCIAHRLIRTSICLNFLMNFLFLMNIDDFLIEYFIGFSKFSVSLVFSNAIIAYVVYFLFELNKRREIEQELNEYYPYSKSMRHEMLQQINQRIKDCIIGFLIIISLFILILNGSIIELFTFITTEVIIITTAYVTFQCSKKYMINLLKKTIKYFQ